MHTILGATTQRIVRLSNPWSAALRRIVIAPLGASLPRLSFPFGQARNWRTLVKIARLGADLAQPVGIVADLLGDHVNYAHFALQLPFNDHEVCHEHSWPLRCLDARPHDQVADARFILQTHEHDAGSSFRPLSMSDDAGNPDLSAALESSQFGRAGDAKPFEFLPQKRKGMAAERQSETSVVGNNLLALCGRR
jgi:hypothetical protein